MPEPVHEISREVVELCRSLGFALAGVCRAQPSAHVQDLRDWLAAGSNGDMHFLEEDAALREDPSRLTCVVKPGDNRARDGVNENVLPVRSFIVVGDQYAVRGEEASTPQQVAWGRGKLARYAQGRDYHQTIKKRLHTLSDALRARFPHDGFVSFVDTVPLMERELAELAGLGWRAKNTLLINRELGSYLFLGGVGTSLILEPPPGQGIDTDHCGSCMRCIDACPTGAITERRVEATKCISYLTIEHQSLIPAEHHAAIGDYLYGCDICQEVCPHNSPRRSDVQPGVVHADYLPLRRSFDLLEILSWTDADRVREFRLTALKRVSLEAMKRNAIVVAGNRLRDATDGVESRALRSQLEVLATDASQVELVRDTARQVLGESSRPPAPVV